MTRDEKLIFSWRVLHCYYQDAGRILPECQSDSIRACLQTLPSSDFNIYTQFYNHADSMCFYRESKEWQERTDRSIQHLEMAAEKASQLLSGSHFFYNSQRHLHFQGREAAFDAAGAYASVLGFASAESRRIRNRIPNRREVFGSPRSLPFLRLIAEFPPLFARSAAKRLRKLLRFHAKRLLLDPREARQNRGAAGPIALFAFRRCRAFAPHRTRFGGLFSNRGSRSGVGFRVPRS